MPRRAAAHAFPAAQFDPSLQPRGCYETTRSQHTPHRFAASQRARISDGCRGSWDRQMWPPSYAWAIQRRAEMQARSVQSTRLNGAARFRDSLLLESLCSVVYSTSHAVSIRTWASWPSTYRPGALSASGDAWC
jgi:hypothetical protein